MTWYVLPALFTVLMWWLSTGVVLCAVRRANATYPLSLSIATALAILGAVGLWVSARSDTVIGVYLGFTSALALWGLHELTFLTGLVTGPRTTPCTSKRNGRAPLLDAVSTVIYHELAIALTGLGVLALTWSGVNDTGTMTYLLLWALRLSAKINVYLGVPNLTEEFLPPQLQYLRSYFCHRPMNMFFPLSITAATLATAALALAAADPAATHPQAASAAMLASLMGLALLEHWFLVLPFNSAQLWYWSIEGEPGAIGAIQATRTKTITGEAS